MFKMMKMLALWVPFLSITSFPVYVMANFIPIFIPPLPPIFGPPLPPIPPLAPIPGLPKIVTCLLPGFPFCYRVQLPCPITCPTSCKMDCSSCRPVCSCDFPGAVCQDPRFVGGDGITFYFHGRKDKDFCLVSDHNIHINAHFIGKRNPKLARDFTWVQSIGILFDNHKVLIAAKKTATWDDNVDRLAIFYDETPLNLPVKKDAMWNAPAASPSITITRTSKTNGLKVEVADNFRVTATVVPITEHESKVHNYEIDTNQDCFAHLELEFKFYNLTEIVDGVLGQTYRSNYVSKAKISAAMPVMGGVNKYISSNLFSTDCAVSKFGSKNAEILKDKRNIAVEYNSLHCSTGLKGSGSVCKR